MWEATKKTVLFVTHDVLEAVQLSNRIIIVAHGGRTFADVQIDLPYPRLQTDPVTRSERIRIECDDTGLCSLAGQVQSVFAAHRAIEDTMGVPGVSVVESHLTF